MNKCFIPNLEKNLAQISLVIFEKLGKLRKNDVPEPKARLRFTSYQVKGQFQTSGNHGFQKFEIDLKPVISLTGY